MAMMFLALALYSPMDLMYFESPLMPSASMAAGVFAGKQMFSSAPLPPPTYRQLTFRRGSIRSARFAPDGQTILYSAAWQGTPVDVFTARPEAPEARSMGLSRTLHVTP